MLYSFHLRWLARDAAATCGAGVCPADGSRFGTGLGQWAESGGIGLGKAGMNVREEYSEIDIDGTTMYQFDLLCPLLNNFFWELRCVYIDLATINQAALWCSFVSVQFFTLFCA